MPVATWGVGGGRLDIGVALNSKSVPIARRCPGEGGSFRIYQSVDGGSKWSRMPTDGLASDRVWTMCLDPAEPRRLLAGSSAGGLHMLLVGPVATTDAVAP